MVGGSLILDDYHSWGGCRKATDEFFRNFVGQFSMDDSFGSMKVLKVK
ncbi:MAG: TylF/MycF family methyltransferase [Bacteroidales bacterium]|nr:TylF/MycF family methyltransferase [Bacteroidales bacterium]